MSILNSLLNVLIKGREARQIEHNPSYRRAQTFQYRSRDPKAEALDEARMEHIKEQVRKGLL